jgi:hypothetical protein
MAPFQVPMNFKFHLFSKSYVAINPFHNNVNLNSPNAIEPTISPNVVPNLNVIVSMGNAFWKRKEKFCEKIVACPSRDPTKPTFNEPKNNNLENQSEKLMGFSKIDKLQSLFRRVACFHLVARLH